MANENQTTLHVRGMSCPSCIRHIKQALGEVKGVHAVDVRLSDGKVMVRHTGQGTSAATLIGALAEAGYDAAAVPA